MRPLPARVHLGTFARSVARLALGIGAAVLVTIGLRAAGVPSAVDFVLTFVIVVATLAWIFVGESRRRERYLAGLERTDAGYAAELRAADAEVERDEELARKRDEGRRAARKRKGPRK
ncbi:hypothetical protein [Longispora albida]|uniref:hypothetical protein n=1 Tax=Longispora albida TaxID=203523 RepID=UPI00035D3F23|nr:hypothetical protein [Longispora albida]